MRICARPIIVIYNMESSNSGSLISHLLHCHNVHIVYSFELKQFHHHGIPYIAALSHHDLNGSFSYPVYLSVRNLGNLSFMGEKS